MPNFHLLQNNQNIVLIGLNVIYASSPQETPHCFSPLNAAVTFRSLNSSEGGNHVEWHSELSPGLCLVPELLFVLKAESFKDPQNGSR